MKMARTAYLVYVSVLSCAHLFVTLWLLKSPPLVEGTDGVKTAYFIALFAGWILAGVLDLALAAYHQLPLTFAVEAIMSNACLVIMSVLNGGFFYAFCAVAPAALIVTKVMEEVLHHHSEMPGHA